MNAVQRGGKTSKTRVHGKDMVKQLKWRFTNFNLHKPVLRFSMRKYNQQFIKEVSFTYAYRHTGVAHVQFISVRNDICINSLAYDVDGACGTYTVERSYSVFILGLIAKNE